MPQVEKTYKDLIQEFLPGHRELQKHVESLVEKFSKSQELVFKDPEELRRIEIAYAGGLCHGFILAKKCFEVPVRGDD